MATVAWPVGRDRRTLRRLSARERQALVVLLGLAAVLTVIDGVATLAWLQLGHAEANPLLVALIGAIGAGPAMAVRVAVGLVLLGLLAVTIGRARLAPYALSGVTGVLLGVGLWHGYGLMFTVTGA